MDWASRALDGVAGEKGWGLQGLFLGFRGWGRVQY